MRVVIDTNVVASAIFFGGKPKEVIDKLMTNDIAAYASSDILEEYTETVEYLKEKGNGVWRSDGLWITLKTYISMFQVTAK